MCVHECVHVRARGVRMSVGKLVLQHCKTRITWVRGWDAVTQRYAFRGNGDGRAGGGGVYAVCHDGY
jgi:hypothetical protein